MPISITAVDLGSAPDNGDGDELRAGGAKINDNDAALKAATEAAIDAIGIDVGDASLGVFPNATALNGLSAKAALDLLGSAQQTPIQREIKWIPGDAASEYIYAEAASEVAEAYTYLDPDAPTSSGTVTLSIQKNGTTEILTSGPVDLKGRSAGRSALSLVGTPTLAKGEYLVARVASSNADMAAQSIAIGLVLAPSGA